jgi:hypothetical protein
MARKRFTGATAAEEARAAVNVSRIVKKIH